MDRDQALRLADRYEKLGRTADAEALRAKAASLSAPAPAAAPAAAAAPVPSRPLRPAPAVPPAPAEEEEAAVEFVPPEEQDAAQQAFEDRLRDDYARGSIGAGELQEGTGYAVSDEELQALRAPSAPGMATEPAKERVRIVVPYGSEMVPETPPPMSAQGIYEEGAPVYGRPVDEPQMASELRTQLDQMESELIRQYIAYGYTEEGARKAAREASTQVLQSRVSPEGEPTTRGEGGIGSALPIPPFFRESRINFREDPETYIEPDGTRRPATSFEKMTETFARQQVVTPELAARARQTRALQRELAFRDIPGSLLYTDEYAEDVRRQIVEATDPYLSGVLSDVDPGTGVGIETPLGAVIRQTGIVSTAVNEAVLGLPLFYDIDDNGNPVDTNQLAFKLNDFFTRSLERMGVSGEDARDLTSGIIGGATLPTGIPVPFQGINRKGNTILDPIGMRSASETETYLGDVVTSLAKGRFAGDELYALPAYVQELATGAFQTLDAGTGQRLQDVDESAIGQAALFYPMILGAGAEMVYGIGPISAVGKFARGTGTVAKAGALAGAKTAQAANLLRTAEALKTGARAADFVAHPVEHSKKVRLIRAAQDLMDDAQIDKPVLDVLMDRAEIKTVVSETISKDVLTPYLISHLIETRPAGATVTVGDLRAMAGDSASGREFLRRMGVQDFVPDSAAWGVGARSEDAYRAALLEYRASAYRPAIEAIVRSGGSEEDQAARIYDLLSDPGVDPLSGKTVGERAAFMAMNPGLVRPGVMSELQLVASGNTQQTLQQVLNKLRYNPKYLPISQDAPVMQSLHAFGEALSQGMPRQGPVAESFARRLGGELFEVEPSVGTREVPDPALLREAAIGAGGRTVANTLENLVPEDLVLVTDSLMVPRQRLTPDVLDEVGRVYGDYAKTSGPLVVASTGPAVNGVPTMVYRWNIDPQFVRDEIFGVNNITRSQIRTAVMDALSSGRPLTESEHHHLADAALSAAYREVLGEARVAEALLAGEQTQRAMQPSVGLGLASAVQERVPGLRTGEVAPAQARPLAEAREPSVFTVPSQAMLIGKNMLGSAIRKASKTFSQIDYAPYRTTFRGQTPFIAEARARVIEEAVAAIPDQFQREVRAAALGSADAEAAFDSVLARRIAAAVLEADAALERRVADLVAQGMPEVEAWSTVAYQQRAGQAAGGLGTQLQGGIIQQAKEQARAMAIEQVKSKAWSTLLNSFFGAPIYGRLIGVDENALRPYISNSATGLTSDITLGNFRQALGKIRKDNPDLDIRGLQRPNIPYGEAVAAFFGWMGKQDPRNLGPVRLMNDAVLDVTAAWAMGMDRQRIVAREATAMMDANPWMRTDLGFGVTSDSAAGFERNLFAVENARAQVASGLAAAAVRASGAADPAADVAAEGARLDQAVRRIRMRALERRVEGAPFTATATGKYSSMLDDLTVRAWRNLTPGAKRDLIDYVYGKMLQEGRGSPDLRTLLYDSLDDPQLNMLFFEKLATTRQILRIIEGLDASVAALPPGQRLPPGDKDLYDLINLARDAGIDKYDVVQIVRQGLLKNAIQSFVEPAIQEMQANARSYGWAPDVEATRRNIVTMVDQISPQDPRFAMAGQDFVDAIGKLQAASKDGKLAENLDALQRSEKLQRALGGDTGAAGDYVAQVLLDTLSMPRTVAASGLLGGGYYVFSDDEAPVPVVIPLPNTRYIGTNLITAPMIAATTLGATGAIRYLRPRGGATAQAGEVVLQAGAQLPEVLRRPLVNSVGQSPNDLAEVLFRTRTGRDVTRGELAQLMREHNISLSRGGLEFANNFARDLARDARLTAEGVKAPALRQYLLRNMDPTRTGFWQYAANATDRMFRQNVFATALQEGLPPAQAAQLARNVVLDYGNVKYTGGLNKYVMFLAFREAMTREVVEAISRDPDSINRLLVVHRDLQKQMDDELLADHARFRLPIGGAKIFDQTASSRNYGPINPALSVYGDLVRFAAMGLQAGAKDVPTGTIAQAVADESLTPIVDMVMADAIARPSSTGRGQKVDDVWVAYALQNSPDVLWPWLKQEYNIVPVVGSEERKGGRLEAMDPETPALGRIEYRFASTQDHARFIRDMAILQVLGFQRTMEDYTKIGLTYGVEDYLDPKRRGLPSTFGFTFGLETPLSAQSQMGAVQKALRQQQGAAKVQTPVQ